MDSIRLKFVTEKRISILREELVSLKNELNNRVNNILEELEYPSENLLLGSEIEWIYPYVITANLKLDIKTIEKYIKNPNAHGFRFFLSNYIDPIKARFGNLSCPLYGDISNGIHNGFSFNEECLNDLYTYLYYENSEKFTEFVNGFLLKILDSPRLKRQYSIPANATSINIESNEKLKRETIIFYLKELGRL